MNSSADLQAETDKTVARERSARGFFNQSMHGATELADFERDLRTVNFSPRAASNTLKSKQEVL
jgi:hypothetical protein